MPRYNRSTLIILGVVCFCIGFLAYYVGRASKPGCVEKFTTVNVGMPVPQPNTEAQTEGARKAAVAYSFAYSLYGSVPIYERLATAWEMIDPNQRQKFEAWLNANKTGNSVNLPRYVFRGEVTIAEDDPYNVIVRGFDASNERTQPVAVEVKLLKNPKYQGEGKIYPEYLVLSWTVSRPEVAKN